MLLKKSFCTENSPDRGREFRVRMWGTSSPDDKLTCDLANVIEAISIDDRGSNCLAAEKLAPGNLGLFQQHRSKPEWPLTALMSAFASCGQTARKLCSAMCHSTKSLRDTGAVQLLSEILVIGAPASARGGWRGGGGIGFAERCAGGVYGGDRGGGLGCPPGREA